MADYRPQFRPTYSFGKKTLVERISDTFYDSFKDKSWKDVKDDYVVTVKNSPKAFKEDIKKNYPVYASVLFGNLMGLAGNYFSAQNAAEQGHTSHFIEGISYFFEFISHTGGSGVTYILLSRFGKGESWSKIATDTTSLAAVTTPLQFGVYAPSRLFVADHNINKGMEPEVATALAQIELLPLYMLAVRLTFRAFASRVDSYLRPKIESFFGKRKTIRENKKRKDVLLSSTVKSDADTNGLEKLIEKAS